MSTYTENYGFIKPELTDPADITQYNVNWVELDAHLNTLFNITCGVQAFSEDGHHYYASIREGTSSVNGTKIIITPNMTNTSANPTLTVDALVEVPIKLSLSTNTSATVTCPVGFLVKDKPIVLIYDEGLNIWKTVDKQKTSASDLYGSVPVTCGGTGGTTAAEARANLGVLPDILVEGEHYGTLEQRPKAGTKGKLFFVTM